MPADIELAGGYTIRVTAVDPTTGNTVSGVTVSAFVLSVETIEGTSAGDLAVGPYLLVPGSGA